jgi:nitrite reductase (NADH) large subunit
MDRGRSTEQAEPRDRDPTDPSAHASRVLVVGNGMVGHRFCEEIASRRGDRRFDVTCVGEEPRPAYDRVHLSEFFAGRSAADLELADRSWYRERGIDLILGERVASIDRARRSVLTQAGRNLEYDALVLATGSAPFVPPIPGVELGGVFVYRTI